MIDLMVGAEGFEPPTLCSQSRCATRLRYAPTSAARKFPGQETLWLGKLAACQIVSQQPAESALKLVHRRCVSHTAIHTITTAGTAKIAINPITIAPRNP